MGGSAMQEGRDLGIYVYVKLIHFVVKKKLTHHCKVNTTTKMLKIIIIIK